jgi:hypothetical protein
MEKLIKSKNEQWKIVSEDLDKSIYNAGIHPPKGYAPGQKKSTIVHPDYDDSKSFDENKALVAAHYKGQNFHVRDDQHLHSLTIAAQKRSK